MPVQVLGKFILTGTDEQNAKIVAALNECNVDLPKLIKRETEVRFKDDMPPRSDGGISWAFYRSGFTPRRILMWTQFGRYPVKKSFLHEVGHAIADDVIKGRKRRDVMDLMNPRPASWGDTTIDGVDKKYRALPGECFADSFMEAVSRFESRLDGWYLRNIRDTELNALRDIVLRDDPPPTEGEDPDDLDEPEDPEDHVGSPPVVEEIQSLRDRIGELESVIEAAKGTLTL